MDNDRRENDQSTVAAPAFRGMTDANQKGEEIPFIDSTVDEDRESPGRVAPRRHREQIKFFAVREVAERLGVSTRTVRRWIENMEL